MKYFTFTILLFISSLSWADKPSSRIYDIGSYVTNLSKTEQFYTQVFDLKVIRRWDSMEMSLDGKNYQTIPLKGLYLQGANGMHLEFLQKADTAQRQVSQQPINHFAIEVNDVAASFKLALKMGATEAFPNTPLQYIKLGEFSVIITQIFGLDGERIQILQVITDDQ
jgi:catechol 2,3-dioxygenase-like lactoylglutathione lyase family enzyme